MPLQKQAVAVNFARGLDLKTDPFQLAVGSFVVLDNSVFDKVGRLTKRNGFGFLPALPDSTSSYVTTFNGNLTAIGSDLKAFNSPSQSWSTKGPIQPTQVSTLPLIRNNLNQSQVDTAISPNGLICTAYTESVPSSSTTANIYKYAIADSSTGQNIVAPTQIISTFGTVSYSPRVFSLGNYFVLVFGSTNGGSNHLQYFSVSSYNTSVTGSVTDVSTNYGPQTVGVISKGAFDGIVANNQLYLSWNGAANSGLKAAYITFGLQLSATANIGSQTATIVAVNSDVTQNTPQIWTSTYVSGSNSGYVVATNQNLGTLFNQKQFFSSASGDITNIALTAQGGSSQLFYESTNTYSYAPTVSSNFISSLSVSQTGSLSSSAVVARSVGLASKGFLVNSVSYFASTYSSPYQPTYFVMNSSGKTVAKLAYTNGGGYLNFGLPSVNVTGSTASFAYLIKDLIQSVNKDTNVSAGTQTNGIYSQTGINLASVQFGANALVSTEIGNNLHLNGGFLWGYDGYLPVENNFHLYPDSVLATGSGSIGSMSAQVYYYQSTYEWTDNQGNAFKSAPSIPVTVTVSSGTSRVIVNAPTLRLTYKTANPIKIVIYRWSAAQQSYYQITSITNPILNRTDVDSVSFVDVNTDAAILGNNIIYTNGGVVENTGAPSFSATTTWDSRLWGIDGEDPNILWYSKQVIETTPVEMSDLFTLFVSPNSAAQGPTGPMKCIAPMDDKLIIFKKNAIYYVNGSGPDNTGANSQYSQPTFITATVGCSTQKSLVLIPSGLMFKSDKGIWLLGRDLSTQYIGKDVEAFNSASALSAVAVPGTNQVRFTLDNGYTLMYDYFTQMWGTFSGIPGISSTLYQDLHSYIDSRGATYQETPNLYLDGSTPTVLSFTTGWLNLAGLQGYKRIYEMFILGVFKTPHRLTVGIAQNYDSSVTQQATIVPDNYSGPWGSGTSWGSVTTWGGNSAVEQWQINFEQQQVQSFQVSLKEYYDPSFGVAAGAGLTISGLSIIAGLKGTLPQNIAAKNKIG